MPEFSIPVGRHCEEIYLLGNVTLPDGYPIHGRRGETAAVLEIHQHDGAVRQIALRNGMEIARSNLVYVATRIEPLAIAAPQALVFTKDPARELYQVLLFVIRTRSAVKELLLQHKNGPPIALFGVTTGTAASGEAAL
jgi:hypothetical protein